LQERRSQRLYFQWPYWRFRAQYPYGRVEEATCIANERERSIGRIELAGGVAEKRPGASGRVLILGIIGASGIGTENSSAKRGIEAADGVTPERKVTNGGIVTANGETQKCVLPFCRVASGIASIRRRTNCLRSVRECKTDKQ
jgi:hypothetical protein